MGGDDAITRHVRAFGSRLLHDFTLTPWSRDENRARIAAQELSDQLGSGVHVSGAENAMAVAQCDNIVLAVPFEGQVATMKSLKAAFRPNSVLITTTVPLATSIGDRGSRVVGVWQGSAAEQVAEFAPEGVQVAAAFQNISAALLSRDAPIDCDWRPGESW